MNRNLVSTPPSRRLRVYSFDPSVASAHADLDTSVITLAVPWESLEPGPVGEYVEVVDVDPASAAAYLPVDLNDPLLLAQDGHEPSESNPQFHQQMAYAVAMATINQFERALGRKVLWSAHRQPGDKRQHFVRRLRIYPHAMREKNAYYSPQKKAVLFGYFAVNRRDAWNAPGTIVHTVLSHDIIAHEVTHAVLDGLHPRFAAPSNVDVLAFHEAFADLVALFQHFAYPGVLKDQIARTRGDLRTDNALGKLAQQFGRAGGRDSLRSYVGKQPNPTTLDKETEPHHRGEVLVAAVFGAFMTVYEARTRDLFRIATNGTGVLTPGAIHPDLTARLADEASRCAARMLQICIRAIDYCPPVDITFGDYLRALVTSDHDLNPEDPAGFRLAIVESFRAWGIQPRGIRSTAVASMLWPTIDDLLQAESLKKGARAAAPSSSYTKQPALDLRARLEGPDTDEDADAEETFVMMPTPNSADRQAIWQDSHKLARRFRDWLRSADAALLEAVGIIPAGGKPSVFQDNGAYRIEVHSVRTAVRSGRDGWPLSEMVVELTQRRRGYLDPARQEEIDSGRAALGPDDRGDFRYRAGCTILIDPVTMRFRRVIRTAGHIEDEKALERVRDFLLGKNLKPGNAFHPPHALLGQDEPFAMLHRGDH